MDQLDSIRDARAVLSRARNAVQQVRWRVPPLASAMRWRSRSAEEFTAEFDRWVALLQRIDEEIEVWDAVLQRHEEAATSGAPLAGGQR